MSAQVEFAKTQAGKAKMFNTDRDRNPPWTTMVTVLGPDGRTTAEWSARASGRTALGPLGNGTLRPDDGMKSHASLRKRDWTLGPPVISPPNMTREPSPTLASVIAYRAGGMALRLTGCHVARDALRDHNRNPMPPWSCRPPYTYMFAATTAAEVKTTGRGATVVGGWYHDAVDKEYHHSESVT